MASEWKDVLIQDIAERVAMGPFGSDIKTDNFVESGVPIIRGGNLTTGRFNGDSFVYLTEEKANQLSSANAFPGDIIFTHRGTLGQVGLIPNAPFNRYIVSQSQMKLACNKKLADPAFIYYFFKSPQGQQALLMNTSQTGVPAISRPVTSLKAISLLLPPLPEQKRIAHILGSLDDKIELNRKMNETLEELARAIFKSWFVDFDPVLAKSEGRHPEGMDAETAKLFPASFVDSEMGRIPKGWKTGKISDLAVITSGKRPPERVDIPTSEISVPLFGGGGIMAFTRTPLYAEAILLTGRVGTLGKIFRVCDPCWASDNTLVLLSHSPFYYEYVFFCLKQIDFESLNRGSTQPLVTQGDLQKQTIIVPSEFCFVAFSKIISTIFEKVAGNSSESKQLSLIRDSLLPHLFSGELVIPTKGI